MRNYVYLGNKFNASNEKIAQIYYGYIYVKSVRNRTNHASSKYTLTPKQIEILKEKGFDFDKYNLSTVRKNINFALDNIENTFFSYNEVPKIIEKESFTMTDKKVGDVVMATCTSSKRVRIDNIDYDIQLVLVNTIKPCSLIGKKIEVEIKQISKKGKIVQVFEIRKITSFLT